MKKSDITKPTRDRTLADKSRFDSNRNLSKQQNISSSNKTPNESSKQVVVSPSNKTQIYRNYSLNQSLTLAKLLFKNTAAGLHLQTNIKISKKLLMGQQLTSKCLMNKVFKTLRSQQKSMIKCSRNSSFIKLSASELAIQSARTDADLTAELVGENEATNINRKTTQKRLKTALSAFCRRGNLLRLLDFNFLLI